jgi:hypothetical protein
METNETKTAQYFDVLIDRKIDPIIMFRILEFHKDILSVFKTVTKDVRIPDLTKEMHEQLQTDSGSRYTTTL